MKKRTEIALDFEVDKLTNSIENVKSGDSFQTEISLLTQPHLVGLTKKMAGNLIGMLNSRLPIKRFIN